MSDIKLKIKLSAYTKGVLPTKVSDLTNDINLISEAPKDGAVYARKNNEWVDLGIELDKVRVIADEDSGIIVEQPEFDTFKIKLNEWKGHAKDLPEQLDPGCTYYVIDAEPEIIVNSGTAYTDENDEEEVVSVSGGNANTTHFDNEFTPLNAKGE